MDRDNRELYSSNFFRIFPKPYLPRTRSPTLHRPVPYLPPPLLCSSPTAAATALSFSHRRRRSVHDLGLKQGLHICEFELARSLALGFVLSSNPLPPTFFAVLRSLFERSSLLSSLSLALSEVEEEEA